MADKFDALILGAGAAGLFCAGQLALSGFSVLLVDRQERAGRKLLISGGGKCNVTNLKVSTSNYIGENPLFCEHALDMFTPASMLDFLDEHNLAWEEREYGQIFLAGGANCLRDVLLDLAQQNGAKVVLGQTGVKVHNKPDSFVLTCSAGTVESKNFIVATGGPAWPSCGATSSGFDLAKRFGHTIVNPVPALTPFAMPAGWSLMGLAGISIEARVSLADRKSGGPEFCLPLLFTHNGISGPAALQISSYWNTGEALCIDFLPRINLEAMLNEPGAGKLLLHNLLGRYLPSRLVKALLPESLFGRKTAELSRQERNLLSDTLHAHKVCPLPFSFKRAEACRGGVSTDEVCPYSMRSYKQQGLCFIGEVLDVCGQLGGYNLHWAWASAFSCANSLQYQ